MLLLNIVNMYEIREKRNRKFYWTEHDILFARYINPPNEYKFFMLNHIIRGQHKTLPFLFLTLSFADPERIR